MLDPLVAFIGIVGVGLGGGVYALYMRDLVRRGRLRRRNEELLRSGNLPQLPDGRVPCPECAEAVLPAARRCPYFRLVIAPRT
jgi:hypothetical protein